MRLSRFSFRRFGAFDKETSLSLSNLSVLVGPNNLGKSTVLRSLQLFFDSLGREAGPGTYGRYSSGPRLRYNPSRDYPKKYEGKRGRRWSTRMVGVFEFDSDDQASYQAEAGATIASTETVTVEYGTDKAHRTLQVVECGDVPSDELRPFLQWLVSHLSYVYIPAARGAQSYRAPLFAQLVSGAIRKTRRSSTRLASLQTFHEDASAELEGLEEEFAEHLRNYLPDVQSVEFELEEPSLLDFLSVKRVQIDDGARTGLDQKGDGFKSLFELALLQFVAEQRRSSKLLFGIEEPESHLHPTSIYDVKATLRDLSVDSQVVITTHSPILIQRDSVRSNIVIDRAGGDGFSCRARQASTLSQIRRSLGIRPQDNLATASVVVVVEGTTEETALPPLLSAQTHSLEGHLRDGTVRVLGAGGASNVPSVLRALVRDASSCVVLLDSDDEGLAARERILRDGLVGKSDVFCIPPRDGCAETEFEDMFEPSVYFDDVVEACGITATVDHFNDARKLSGSKETRVAKWSVVLKILLEEHGLSWAQCKDEAKAALARAVSREAAAVVGKGIPLLGSMSSKVAAYLAE